MLYCSDLDLLRWEPALPAEAAVASQTLLSVPARLEGTLLTLDDGRTLNGTHVQPGTLVVCSHRVDDALHNCYAVVHVSPDGRRCLLLRVPTILDKPRSTKPPPGPLSVEATFRTFVAQRLIVSETLRWMRGIDPRLPTPTLRSAPSLRTPCITGTLHLIYAGLGVACGRNNVDLLVREELYHRLYRQAIREAGDLDRDVHAPPGKCQPTPFTRRNPCCSTN